MKLIINHQSSIINHKSGFSIPEIMISIFITVMIITVIVIVQNSILEQQNFISDSYLSMNMANLNIQQMTKELRNAQTGNNGAYLFEALNDQEIRFYSNADSDDDLEKIIYRLDGSDLIKSVINPTTYPIQYLDADAKTSTIATNVISTQPIFSYYNGNYPTDTVNNPLPANQRPTQTRLIKINLTINTNSKNLEKDYQIESFAQIRTLKDNL